MMKYQQKHRKVQTILLNTPQAVNYDITTIKRDPLLRVLEVRNLTDSTYVLRFERNERDFHAGQHIILGMPGDHQMREYSIYSPTGEPWFEVLIKEVETGLVSRKLHWVKPGDYLKFDGPFGFFTIDEKNIDHTNYLFIATGTGIAPFHSMAGSYPGLNYKILHGVRYASEAYERSFYPSEKYVLCTSRDEGDFHGRVTDYLSLHGTGSANLVYLCGNCEMIYDVYDLLVAGGFNPDHIKTEVYF